MTELQCYVIYVKIPSLVVYGQTKAKADSLRTFEGGKKMLNNEYELLT